MSRNSTKRSAYIDGHKTSISLENEFWDALREIAASKNSLNFGANSNDCQE